MIRKVGNTCVLYSRSKNPRTGRRRRLGTFRTRAEAVRRERQIQFFKRHRP
ncbi:MAG: hypothetical protein ACRDFW_13895 [bacterium]